MFSVSLIEISFADWKFLMRRDFSCINHRIISNNAETTVDGSSGLDSVIHWLFVLKNRVLNTDITTPHWGLDHVETLRFPHQLHTNFSNSSVQRPLPYWVRWRNGPHLICRFTSWVSGTILSSTLARQHPVSDNNLDNLAGFCIRTTATKGLFFLYCFACGC